MQYDPIKRVLGKAFNRTPFLRKVFYSLLDMLLLRAWHVGRELKKWGKSHTNKELKILDAGSGFGQYTYRMSRLFPKAQIKGVDVKEEQIADCNQFFSRIGKGDKVKMNFFSSGSIFFSPKHWKIGSFAMIFDISTSLSFLVKNPFGEW